MFDRIPVRLRLSLGHATWMALLFLILGYSLYRIVERNLYRSVDASLLISAQSIRDARFARGFNSPLMERYLNQFFGEKYIRPHAQLVDLSGKISLKTTDEISLPITLRALTRAERGFETFETFPPIKGDRPSLRQVSLPVMRLGRFTGELIQVGATLDSTYHTLRQITWVLWTSLPLGVLLSVGFGYLLTKRALKPVLDMSQAATQLSSADLSVRLPLPVAKDELRHLAETFNEMLHRLEDGFLRLRRFTGDVSHELRTPLAVLSGEAEFALRKTRSPDDYRTSLETILTESRHMTGIVENLLLLARAESRAVAMTWMPLHLQDFIRDLVQGVAPMFEKSGVELTVNTTNAPENFEANPGYLTLALRNILLNAAKHSTPKSKVILTVTREEPWIIFTVKDHGEGIPPESLPYVFDPFFRADTARNRAAGGAGIGLSLAMALVKLHGGSISVSSRPHEGATFVLKIPPPTKTEPISNSLS